MPLPYVTVKNQMYILLQSNYVVRLSTSKTSRQHPSFSQGAISFLDVLNFSQDIKSPAFMLVDTAA